MNEICKDCLLQGTPMCKTCWRYEEEEYIPSSTNGDYSPSNPWDAPGMIEKDFI